MEHVAILTTPSICSSAVMIIARRISMLMLAIDLLLFFDSVPERIQLDSVQYD